MSKDTIITDDPVEALVNDNRKWLQHSVNKNIPITHRMFVNESYFKSFWECTDHAIIIIDKEMNIIEANPSFSEMLGITPMEARNVNIKQLIPDFRCYADYTNINAIITGDNYSFTSDSFVHEKMKTDRQLIPVRVVATRVPSQVHEEFKHIVMHIYVRSWANTPVSQSDIYSKTSWNNLIKELISKHFVGVLSTIFGVSLLIALGGNLGDVVHKVLSMFI